MGSGTADEFPLLSALGLYAAEIRGDGNCLFNALSDQIYGHQNGHAAIRARVIEHMRARASHYKQFIDVHPGGGIRRNPKRKTAGGYASPSTSHTTGRRGGGGGSGGAGTQWKAPSTTEVDRVFERHLQSMAQGGTWGDHLEISAFAEAYGCDVKIYQRDFAYIVAPPPVVTSEEGVAGELVQTEKHASQDLVETAVQQPAERKQEEVPASDEEPELHRQTKEHERTTEGPEQIATRLSIAQQPETCGLESRDVKREECDSGPSRVSPVVMEAEPSHQQQPSTLIQEQTGPSEHQTDEPKARVDQAQPPVSQRPTAHIAYHSWEHYSSIRNLAGPHLGPPNVTARVLTLAEEQEQRKQLAQTPYTVLPWQIDVVSKSLPFLTDKTSITQALITAKGDINSAVCALLDRDDHVERDDGTTSVGSSSRASWQESSSVERDPDSDDEENEQPGFGGGPKKKRQDRRKSRGGFFSASSGIARSSSASGIGKLRVRRSADARHALSQLASFSDASASQESLLSTTTAAAAAGGWDSETSSSFLDGPAHGSAGSSTHPSSVDESPADCIAVAHSKPHDPTTTALSQTTIFSAGGAAPGIPSQTNAGCSTPSGSSTKIGNRPPVRLKLLGPRPPAAAPCSDSSVTFTAGGGAASSSLSRMTARDRKDIKKLAQKAARKERHLQESQQHQQQQQQQNASSVTLTPARDNDGAGNRPTAETPPVVVDTLRTLYI